MYRKNECDDLKMSKEANPFSDNTANPSNLSFHDNDLNTLPRTATPLIDIEIQSVLISPLKPLGRHKVPSGIFKTPSSGQISITKTGLVGDQQGDTAHHGGPEKAIHHYPFDHYADWRQDFIDNNWPANRWFSDQPIQTLHGGFGENISTVGITEADICIGDIFRLGTAVVQVSQARQPCWRLNERFGNSGMAKHVQNNGRTGWYYRVIEEGHVQVGDHLCLIERPVPGWSLKRILDIFYRDALNTAALQFLATLPVLTPSWRQLAERRLSTQSVESWSRRLITPEDI